jgi:hypothetical protein
MASFTRSGLPLVCGTAWCASGPWCCWWRGVCVKGVGRRWIEEKEQGTLYIKVQGRDWDSVLPPFVEDGWDPSIPPAPELIRTHGSHKFNMWQASLCPMLFLHLAEFKASRRESGHQSHRVTLRACGALKCRALPLACQACAVWPSHPM